jgi:hypothetical protein
MGLPGSWAVLFVRAEVVHPAGCLDISPMATPWLLLSGVLNPSAPGTIAFRDRIPAARTFARLRIGDVSFAHVAARLRYRPAGLGFGRAGFAPAGRLTVFHEVIVTSFPTDQPFLVAPRLTTGLPCSALTGRDSHPLDDIPHFSEVASPPFLRTSLSWSHRLFGLSAGADT